MPLPEPDTKYPCILADPPWRFRHKTKAFTWVKLSKNGLLHWGMGTATRQGTEDCLLWTRGDRSLVVAHDVHQTIVAPVREHSRKPDEQYDRIERLLGMQEAGGKLELFARQSWPGWDCWGNETDKFVVGGGLAQTAAQQAVMSL